MFLTLKKKKKPKSKSKMNMASKLTVLLVQLFIQEKPKYCMMPKLALVWERIRFFKVAKKHQYILLGSIILKFEDSG